MKFIRFFISGLLMVAMVASSAPVYAQARSNLNIIRDVEIELAIEEWVAPLLEAAGLGPNSVNIVLVQSPQLNAFVAGGANIFIYTGLIEATDDPGELIGVMAHEIGHIAGGHLIGGRAALKRSSYEAILGTVLGIGAAILTGNGRAASALSVGGQALAAQNFLAHSRVNESAADQAGISYLEKSEMNPKGLISFFRKLENQELLPVHQQNEYVRTHPLTENRINTIQKRVDDSAYNQVAWPDEWLEQHKRMKAKLLGFITPERVVWDYNDRDHSFAAKYARAIAAYRMSHIDEALLQVDALLMEEPDNPHLYEIKAQILSGAGRVDEALPALKKSAELMPQAAMFRVALAAGLVETAETDDDYLAAIQHLEFALQKESRSSRVYRLLARAYGRLGDDSMAKINLAEEAVLQRRYDYARQLIDTILETGEPDDRAVLKAQDLDVYLTDIKNQ